MYFSIVSTPVCHDVKRKTFNAYDYQKADTQSLCSFLLDHDFSEFYKSLDIEYLWSYLKCTIHEAVSWFVPRVKINSKNLPKWFTSEITHIISKIQYLRCKLRIKPFINIKTKVAEKVERLQHNISTAKVVWVRKIVDKFAGSSNNKIYSYIRSLSKKTIYTQRKPQH